MNKIAKIISVAAGNVVFTGLLKVKPDKWCFINDGAHYFKIFYRRDAGKISVLGDRIQDLPLPALKKALEESAREVQVIAQWV